MLLGEIGDLNVRFELAQIGYAVPLTSQPDDATEHAALAFERRFGLSRSEDIRSPTLRAGLSFVADRLTEAGIDYRITTYSPTCGTGRARRAAPGDMVPATPATQTSQHIVLPKPSECHETLAMWMLGRSRR